MENGYYRNRIAEIALNGLSDGITQAGGVMKGVTVKGQGTGTGMKVEAKGNGTKAEGKIGGVASKGNASRAGVACPCDCDEVETYENYYLSETPSANSIPIQVTETTTECNTPDPKSNYKPDCNEIKKALNSMGYGLSGLGTCGCSCNENLSGLSNAKGEETDATEEEIEEAGEMGLNKKSFFTSNTGKASIGFGIGLIAVFLGNLLFNKG